jgi:hypothetical protein
VLPLLIVLGPKNVIVGTVFEHPERGEVDEIGDLNSHRPEIRLITRQISFSLIRLENFPSGNNLLLSPSFTYRRNNEIFT